MRQIFSRLAPVLALACAALLPVGARAADPTFTVSRIHVDASAASASAAQAIAIDQGRPKAWDILYKRIAKQADWSKEPKLDTVALRGLSHGYSATNEKRSTTRYVADVTYVFSPVAVARVLRTISSDYALAQARRILVIPMAPTFNRDSNWTSAFSSPRFTAASNATQKPRNGPNENVNRIRSLRPLTAIRVGQAHSPARASPAAWCLSSCRRADLPKSPSLAVFNSMRSPGPTSNLSPHESMRPKR